MARDDRMWGHDSYTYECYIKNKCSSRYFNKGDIFYTEETKKVKKEKNGKNGKNKLKLKL